MMNDVHIDVFYNKGEVNMDNEKTKSILKNYDLSLTSYHDAIKLLDYYDLDVMRSEFDTRLKALMLKEGSKRTPSQAKKFNLAYQLLNKYVVSNCVSKYDCIYIFKDEWIKISEYDVVNDVLKLLCHAMSDHIDAEKFTKLSKMLKNEMLDLNSNGIIQFNDCYIDHNKIIEGQYQSSLPDFMLPYNVYDIVDKDEMIEPSDEFKDLCMHICQNDQQTYNRFIDDLSMSLSNSQHFNQTNGKMMRLYGPTAQNGKSTLLNHLQLALTSHNMTSFNISNLRDYYLEMTTRHLVAFDPEEQEGYWGEEITRNIKTIVTSEMINVRQIYSKPIKLIPITTLISATNIMPKSNDKTSGLSRRLDWFYVKDQLVRDDDWFIRLNSAESLEQTIRALFSHFIQLTRRGQLSPMSELMQKTLDLFNKSNNSAYAFIQDTNIKQIKGRRVSYVWELYEDYCYTQDYTKLGKQKFNQTLEQHLNLKRQLMKAEKLEMNQIDEKDQYLIAIACDPDKRVNAWVEIE